MRTNGQAAAFLTSNGFSISEIPNMSCSITGNARYAYFPWCTHNSLVLNIIHRVHNESAALCSHVGEYQGQGGNRYIMTALKLQHTSATTYCMSKNTKGYLQSVECGDFWIFLNLAFHF